MQVQSHEVRVLLLLLLCACNQIFDLHKTKLRFPDGAAKADPMCTDGSLPAFGVASRVVIANQCTSYSPAESIDLAMSSCGYIFAGAIDSDTTSALQLPSSNGDYFSDGRLAPEGDRLIARRFNMLQQAQGYELFVSSNGVWTHDKTLPFSVSTVVDVGMPSRFDPGAHVMMRQTDGKLHERVDDGSNTWPERAAYDAGMLTGDTSAYVMMASLTPDGRRMVFKANLLGGDGPTHIMYVERSSIDVAFSGPGQALDVPGQVGSNWPYLTENCGKLYYSDLSTIYVAEQ